MGKYGLDDWNQVDDDDWPVLLAGNGASRAVSDKFAYNSLLAAARLGPDDRALFRELKTSNFEEVLRALDFARVVHEQLGGDPDDVKDRRAAIRRSLVRAVKDHHVAWNEVQGARLLAIGQALRGFDAVFTTSYDLLFYWAMNHNGASGFMDFFRHYPDFHFDADQSEVAANTTPLYWLHGGLHIYRWNVDGTAKRINTGWQDLLQQFASGGQLPLYVAEGTAEQKRRSIRRSDYLTFCLDRFEDDERPLVIFGQALGSSDRHLIDSIGSRQYVAYGVFPSSQRSVDKTRADVATALDRSDIYFFDSTTHPLGHPALKVR